MFFFCCFKQKKSGSKKKSRRRRTKAPRTTSGQLPSPKEVARSSTKQGKPEAIDVSQVAIASAVSIRSETELFYDCKDDFSSEGGLSPKHSLQSVTPRHSYSHEAPVVNGVQGGPSDYCSECTADDDVESETDPDADVSDAQGGASFRNIMSCLPILQKVTSSGPSFHIDKDHSPSRLGLDGAKPVAGHSFMRRDPCSPAEEAYECWEDCDGTTFKVRSIDYMRTKQKVCSSKALYRLVAVDFFSFPSRTDHIAERVTLPQVNCPYLDQNEATVDIPPLLIFNLQLPTYPPSLFGGTDGPGHSIVYYFQLPDDFHPSKVENQNFLRLFERFVANGRESDGTPTRDRLKIIPRVANPDEWLVSGPLSQTEFKLLKNYNEKPVMTKPQHAFYMGPNYLEVDLDIHSYAFLAKRALVSFMSRLSEVVFENAFVLQGNIPDELPEQVLGCTRIHKVDFTKIRSFVGDSEDLKPGGGDAQDGIVEPAMQLLRHSP